MRPKHIGQRRRSGHQILSPSSVPCQCFFGIDIHQVGGRIGVDHDRLGIALAIDFHPRDGIPARELHPGGVAESALGIDNVEEFSRVVNGNQYENESRAGGGSVSRPPVGRPHHSSQRHTHAGKQHGVGSAKPVEQRNDGKAGQRSAGEVGGVKRRNMLGLAGKHHGELQAGDKEGHGRSHIDRGEPKEIRPRKLQ